LGTDTSSQFRFNIWLSVMDLLRYFWVQGIGMGPNAFIRIYNLYANEIAWRAVHAHNTFLDIIVHSGVGALVAFLAFLFGTFKRGILALSATRKVKIVDTSQTHIDSQNANQNAIRRIFIAAGLASLAVFVVFGMGEYIWFYPRVMLVFWVTVGMLKAGTTHV